MSTTENNKKYDKVEEFKCPNCSGAMIFDSETQNMKCPYCESEFDLEALKNYEDISQTEEREPVWSGIDEDAGQGEWSETEKTQIKRYICQSCAGEIITDATTVASQCPYCGNAVVIASELEGSFRPDLVIPFKLDRDMAIQSLSTFLNDKKLLPKCFRTENHIEEILGVYVPFWLYNCTAKGSVVLGGQKIKHWSDARFNYTKTDHFKIHREGSVQLAKVPADGSQKMDDALMDSLEPYDYSAAVDFQTGYLAGYLAEKYDVTSEENLDRVNKRITETLIQQFQSTVQGYSNTQLERKDIDILEGKIELALLPLWMLRTKYNGEEYIFAMNGQTGKFVGELPIDNGRVAMYFGAVFAAMSAAGIILSLLMLLLV